MTSQGHYHFDGIDVIALDRSGGVSTGDFSSLNLARYVGDDPEDVLANLAIATQLVQTSNGAVLRADHGNTVHVVGPTNGIIELPVGDAAVTKEIGVALVALAADCVAGAIVDPVQRVVGVFHAGWKGVLAQVVQQTWKHMRELGASSANARAVLGPSICGSCYEVQADRVDEFREARPECVVDDRHLDVAAGIRAQLDELGIAHNTVSGCTYEDDALFSYRRAQGQPTGRGGVIVCMQERVNS